MGVPGGGEARQQGGSGPPPPPPADPLPPVPLPLRTGTDTTCHDGAQKSGNVYEKVFDTTGQKNYFQGKMFKNIGKNHKNIPLSDGVVAAAGGLWSRPAVPVSQ